MGVDRSNWLCFVIWLWPARLLVRFAATTTLIGITAACGNRQWVTVEPEDTGLNSRIKACLFPPSGLIATAMYLAMMAATQRDGEFIAHLAAERPGLRKSKVMGIRRPTAADQAWLPGHQSHVIPVANPT